MPNSALESLTPRELEILTMIGEGDSLPEIAQKLHRSLKTIESHRLSLGRKLNASNRVELAKIAIAAGLVSITDASQTQATSASGMDPQQQWAATELEWLQRINTAVEMAVGGEYLRRFCLAASQLPGVHIAAVCTPDPLQVGEIDPYLRCVMAAADNGVPLDPVRYDAHQTPCQQIIEEGAALFEHGVLKAYPNDQFLQHFKAESYVGVQLVDLQGHAIGGLGVIGSEPMQGLPSYKRVLEFFAPRVAAELEQHKRVEQLRTEQNRIREQLRQRDEELKALGPHNESATPLARIGSRVDQLVGERFLRALTDAICEECGVSIASVCTPASAEGEPGFYTLAISENGKQIDSMWIKRSASACALFSEQSLIVSERETPKRFPHCTIAVEGDYQAYIGARLELEGDREYCGGLWILNKDAIADTTPIEAVLLHYAPRVAAEVDQAMYIQRLHEQQDQLEKQAASPTPQDSSQAPAGSGAYEAALLRIQQQAGHLAGPGFFRGVTDALCTTFGVRYAGICIGEPFNDQPGFNAISVSENGEQVDTFRYAISGTPCEKTVQEDYYYMSTGVMQAFPEDEVIKKMQIDGYAGMCLQTQSAGRIGIMWAIDTKPLESSDIIERVFRHFTPRLSSELEQFIELEELRTVREHLEQTIADENKAATATKSPAKKRTTGAGLSKPKPTRS